MIVTPAKAGVQFKEAWIPAFAGMTEVRQSISRLEAATTINIIVLPA